MTRYAAACRAPSRLACKARCAGTAAATSGQSTGRAVAPLHAVRRVPSHPAGRAPRPQRPGVAAARALAAGRRLAWAGTRTHLSTAGVSYRGGATCAAATLRQAPQHSTAPPVTTTSARRASPGRHAAASSCRPRMPTSACWYTSPRLAPSPATYATLPFQRAPWLTGVTRTTGRSASAAPSGRRPAGRMRVATVVRMPFPVISTLSNTGTPLHPYCRGVRAPAPASTGLAQGPHIHPLGYGQHEGAWRCDACGSRYPAGTHAFHCFICNYGECPSCFTRPSRSKLKLPSAYGHSCTLTREPAPRAFECNACFGTFAAGDIADRCDTHSWFECVTCCERTSSRRCVARRRRWLQTPTHAHTTTLLRQSITTMILQGWCSPCCTCTRARPCAGTHACALVPGVAARARPGPYASGSGAPGATSRVPGIPGARHYGVPRGRRHWVGGPGAGAVTLRGCECAA